MKEKFAAHESTPFQTPCFEYHLDYVREVLLIRIFEWTCFEVRKRTITTIIEWLTWVMWSRDIRSDQIFVSSVTTRTENRDGDECSSSLSFSSHCTSIQVVSIKINSTHLNQLVSWPSFLWIIKSLDYWLSWETHQCEHQPRHCSHSVLCSDMHMVFLNDSCSKDNDCAHW